MDIYFLGLVKQTIKYKLRKAAFLALCYKTNHCFSW